MTVYFPKRQPSAGLIGLLLLGCAVRCLAADPFYINSGIVRATYPPDHLPMIDATNVVNIGEFSVANTLASNQLWLAIYHFSLRQGTNVILPPVVPEEDIYQLQNVLAFTNRGRFYASPGLWLNNYTPAAGPGNRPLQWFVNEGLVLPTAAQLGAALELVVDSRRILNRGRLIVGGLGRMNLTGESIDLRHGQLTYSLEGVPEGAWSYAMAWGTLSNPVPALNPMLFSRPDDAPLTSLPYDVLVGLPAVVIGTQTILAPPIFSYVRIYPNPPLPYPQLPLYQYAYVSSGGPHQPSVFMGPGWTAAQWVGVWTNPLTRAVQTNYLILEDGFPVPGQPIPILLADPAQYAWLLNPPGGARPLSIQLWFRPTSLPAGMEVLGGSVYQPASEGLLNQTVSFMYAAFRTVLIPYLSSPSHTIPGSTWTNVAGRMEVVAENSLDLSHVNIDVPSILTLEAHQHFVGATNAQILAPLSRIKLASTNGLLKVKNLLFPTVPRFSGYVEGLSLYFFAQETAASWRLNRILMLTNWVQFPTESVILDLELRNTNPPSLVVISDRLNVLRSCLIDAERLTLTANIPPEFENPPHLVADFSPAGELRLMTNDFVWSASFPRLRWLTNDGGIYVSNSVYFVAGRLPPFISGSYEEPYEAWINRGKVISAGSIEVWSKELEHRGRVRDREQQGVIWAGAGSVRLRGDRVQLGTFPPTDSDQLPVHPDTGERYVPPARIQADLGDVQIEGASLLLTNQVIVTGRTLVLNVTNEVSDLEATNNVMTTGGGVTLMRKPLTGDLRGTTITNRMQPYAVSTIVWAGNDIGPTPAGFTNNVAIGRLILDASVGSRFVFQGLGVSNALYVDQLILLNSATNELNNAFPALNIAPNLTVYYADLIVGGRRLAEPVDASRYNHGRLRWVPGYADGFYGSTNLQIGARTIRVNTALRESKELDSDGDGIVNALDPFPILVPEDVPVTAAWEGPGTVVLTWPSRPGITNTVWEATSLNPPDWRAVVRTNFATLPLPPAEPCSTPPCPVNLLPGRAAVRLPAATEGVRFYRVEVEVPIR